VTLIRAGLFIIAIVGIIAPFKLVEMFLSERYPLEKTGLAAPLDASLPLYTIALVVACVVSFICYRLIVKDTEPTDKQDGLDNSEDLPY